MKDSLILQEIPEASLDAILSLSPADKAKYFDKLIDRFFPKVNKNSVEYQQLVEYYVSSFYVEKLYRCNRFFNEKFIPIYTQSGLIRNIVAEAYYTEDELILH